MADHPLTIWRETKGLSQLAAARELGVKRWTINSIETGRRKPSFALVARIETLTGISRHELRPDVFGDADDRPNKRKTPSPLAHTSPG